MEPVIQQIMVKTAAYIEATQPLIDQHNEERSAFVKRATQAAKVLAQRGVIGTRQVDQFVDKVAANPTDVWGVVEKLASLVGADQMGEVGREKVASVAGSSDPFERRFFGDLSDSRGSGMVD
jgi:hypothetical protein